MGCRRSLPVLAIALALIPGSGRALPRALREAVREHRLLSTELHALLHKTGAHHSGTLVHQIRSPLHREQWRRTLTAVRHSPGATRGALDRWLSSGSYHGLWTLPEADARRADGAIGWYSSEVGGAPVHIRLRPDALVFDRDDPAHAAAFESWRASNARLRPGPASAALEEKRFFRDLGIAGVVRYDVYGRKCIVLLNPRSIVDVRFQ